jgi:hypothetical protein
MARPRLRVYYGADDSSDTPLSASHSARETVTVPLGDVCGWLVDAVRSGRTWLQDFADDEVTISHDLYETIVAYQHYRRPSA